MYKVDKSRNAVHSLVYHLIICVKYRQSVFSSDKLVSDIKTIVEEISSKFGVDVIEQECGVDHIHILFRSKPKLDMIKFVNSPKGVSSRKIRQKHKAFLADKLWGKHFWAPSYFLSTTGNVTIDILKDYVEGQRREQSIQI